MIMQIVGYKDINFQNNNGDTIIGKVIYVVNENEGVVGVQTDKIFLKQGIELPKNVKMGDKLNIDFDHKGKPQAIYEVK